MKEKLLLFFIGLTTATFSFAQVQMGVGTKTPVTTLQVVGDAAGINNTIGITFPTLTGDQLVTKTNNAAFTLGETATMVYVTTAATGSPTPVSSAVNVNRTGFFFWNGNEWIATSGATVGDVKTGFQTADHNGWILLNGRAKTTLTPTQQANFEDLFGVATTNLPQTSGAGATSATYLADIDGDSNTVGSIAGNTDNLWESNDLPDLSHNHRVDPPNTNTSTNGAHKHRHSSDKSFLGFGGSSGIGINPLSPGSYTGLKGAARTTQDGNHRHSINIPAFNSVTANPGGSATSAPTNNRTLDINTFVYLGN